jgi:hypothetical protein
LRIQRGKAHLFGEQFALDLQIAGYVTRGLWRNNDSNVLINKAGVGDIE